MKPIRAGKPKQPTVVVIAGPNGAGKSTAAPYLLKQALGILEFVNADQIAVGLSGGLPNPRCPAALSHFSCEIANRQGTKFKFFMLPCPAQS